MKKILSEPFLHFIGLGLLLFLLFSLVSGPEERERDIVIDDPTLDHIVSLWELQWKRPPTREELQGLVEQYIEQEVYYREALRMDLDHNDEIVKRRLSQKMEFLSDDLSAMIAPPTEENLRRYYETNKEKYQTAYAYSLYQVPFTSSRHADPETAASQVLQQTNSDDPESLLDEGDPFLLPGSIRAVSADRLGRDFGVEFTEALPDLPVGQWAGPVKSGYGWHLVYLQDRQPPQIPEFEQVRQEVQRDFEYDKSRENRESIYSELRRGYNIRIEAEGLDDEFRKELVSSALKN